MADTKESKSKTTPAKTPAAKPAAKESAAPAAPVTHAEQAARADGVSNDLAAPVAPVTTAAPAAAVADSPAAPAIVDPADQIPGGEWESGLWTVYGQHCQAAVDVLKERCRQVSDEGFTTDRDDAFTDYQLPRAAVCYAINSAGLPPHRATLYWPFAPAAFKPVDRRAGLVKAAALLLAEIERLDRADLAA